MRTIILIFLTLGTLSACMSEENMKIREATDKWKALVRSVPLSGLWSYENDDVICYVYYDRGSALQCFQKKK